MSTETKRCTGCKTERPLEDYQRDAGGPGGRRSRCKQCTAERLPEPLRSHRGLSPSLRAELDAAAKDRAMRFCWAVKARNAAEIERIASSMSWHDLAALAINLAEGITPGSLRLLEVTRAGPTLAGGARSAGPGYGGKGDADAAA